ncbi:MAG: hypothetical protein ACRDRJ_44195 [Streptosporangiaceae bacterium]
MADPGRCAGAGIPEGTAFATKPELALRMIIRTLDARIPASWVTPGWPLILACPGTTGC